MCNVDGESIFESEQHRTVYLLSPGTLLGGLLPHLDDEPDPHAIRAFALNDDRSSVLKFTLGELEDKVVDALDEDALGPKLGGCKDK